MKKKVIGFCLLVFTVFITTLICSCQNNVTLWYYNPEDLEKIAVISFDYVYYDIKPEFHVADGNKVTVSAAVYKKTNKDNQSSGVLVNPDDVKIVGYNWFVSVNDDYVESEEEVFVFSESQKNHMEDGKYSVTCNITVEINDPEFDRPLRYHRRYNREYQWIWNSVTEKGTLEEIK